MLTYQQLNILLERESKRVSQIRQDEAAITKINRERRREWCADMCLFSNQIARSVVSVFHIEWNEKANIKSNRDRRREWIVDMRLLACAMGRSVISFWAIVGWMSIGTVFGGLLAHNFLSVGVFCDQPICAKLRFDQRTILD